MSRPDKKLRVTFEPMGEEVTVREGALLSDAAKEAGIGLAMPCAGNGTCGHCVVRLSEGGVDESLPVAAHLSPSQIKAGYVLACQTRVMDDITVEVPERSLSGSEGVLLGDENAVQESPDPVFRRLEVSLSEPSLTENADDMQRLETALRQTVGRDREFQAGLGIMRQLPVRLRKKGYQLIVDIAGVQNPLEIARIHASSRPGPAYGLAVDLGTSTVAVEMVELDTGRTVQVRGSYNRQSSYGADVITRIIYADEYDGGLDRLQEAAVSTINRMVEEMTFEEGASSLDIAACVVGGNTTMIHFLLGIPPTNIRLEPYIPAVTRPSPVRASQLDLKIHPRAYVYCLPGVSSYVGGDITAGVMATSLDMEDEIALFMDIGTNGEMVLGNREWLLSCSCSAGPAFEGVGLSSGMRAVRGAIQKVDVADGKLAFETVGGDSPQGICGSGFIDLISALWKTGAINRSGRISSDGAVREGDDGPELVVVPGSDSGTGSDIVVSEGDLKNLIRSKAAVYAGLRVMLNQVGMSIDDVDRVTVAGGFGNYLNVARAIEIGLLPDLPLDRFRYAGNTSLQGSRKWLLDGEARERAQKIAESMTYLELSVGNEFMDEFMKALFLPHTDMELFPSVKVGQDGASG